MRSPSSPPFGGVGHERGLMISYRARMISKRSCSDARFWFHSNVWDRSSTLLELLTGNRLSLLIERLLESYDHVVIRFAPPVMGLADAPLIASRVEGIIYAVESTVSESGRH